MSIKNIIWDFDGVIMDSIPTKTSAFAHIFRNFPKEKVAELIQYHLDNGGISRFDKIDYFFSQILKQACSKEEAQRYADEFAKYSSLELYKPAYLIPETVHFIKSYSQKYPMHIASGAWEVDLVDLCKIHGLESYFISIHGSPTPKTVWVTHILKTYKYHPEETCIIGDSIQDYQAGKDNKILYYGFNNIDMKPLSDIYLEDFSILEK